MSTTIAVEALRVGMYIQLDGGWLSHPFPLSSFRISAAAQIATLRELGLTEVRWVPEKSELAEAPVPVAPAAVAAPSPEEEAAARRRAWLAAQREATRLCERQHGEAAQAWREASDAVAARPLHAGRRTEALGQAILDKMLSAGEISIRLVAGGGDRGAAHALNVAVISLLIGRALGLDEGELLDLGVGALAHDVGKIDVCERYRHPEPAFTAVELEAYRDHVAKGVLHGRRMALRAGALAVIEQHHEHADGGGFPGGLGLDQIALAARIVGIVNRYDNLCNPPARTQALTPHEAVALIFAQGHARGDTLVLNAFIRLMGVYPAGSLVQLTDDRYAMVVGVNSGRPLKPRVLVHEGGGRGARAPATPLLLDLEGQPHLGIRRSLAPTRVPTEVLQSLDPRPRVAYYFEPTVHEPRPVALAA